MNTVTVRGWTWQYVCPFIWCTLRSHIIFSVSHTLVSCGHRTQAMARRKGYSRKTYWWKLLLCLPLGNKIYYTLCQVSILGTTEGDTCITYSKNNCKHTSLRMLQKVKRGRVANPHWADVEGHPSIVEKISHQRVPDLQFYPGSLEKTVNMTCIQ